MCPGVFPARVFIDQLCAWCPERSDEGIEPPRSRVTMMWVSHDGCWEPTVGPLEEQLVLLTAELSPALETIFLKSYVTFISESTNLAAMW